jgi:hypothetical protein
LPAFVDVLLEMHWSGPAAGEGRRRRLLAWSRFEETPRRLLVELSADGTDYAAVADGPDEPDDELGRVLEGLLRASPGLTAKELSERWPAGSVRPRPRALADRLRELSGAGRLTCAGRGHRFAPYRYRLADDGPAATGPGAPAADTAG